MAERDVRHGRVHPDWPRCSLCGKQVRSLYSLPSDRKALMCSACFFDPIRAASEGATDGT